MILECTDCRFCVSFEDGYRVICANPSLTPDAVNEYHPVGEGDAFECMGFSEGDPQEFWGSKFSEAERFSEEHFAGEVTYPGILAWFLAQLDKDDPSYDNFIKSSL